MIAITLDIDWAPDFVIDWVADRLIEKNVKATWFVTHASHSIERLRWYKDLFELGIHPNFLPGSTHGNTPDEVLDHCLQIVPEGTSMRTHGLVQSTRLLEHVMTKTPIRTDVSLFLPYAENLQPIEYQWKGKTLLRLPYFWEDDFEMARPKPNFKMDTLISGGGGLKIINFHPVHIYLNSYDSLRYDNIKKTYSLLSDAPKHAFDGCDVSSLGTCTLFKELIDYLSVSGNSRRINNIL